MGFSPIHRISTERERENKDSHSDSEFVNRFCNTGDKFMGDKAKTNTNFHSDLSSTLHSFLDFNPATVLPPFFSTTVMNNQTFLSLLKRTVSQHTQNHLGTFWKAASALCMI